MMRRPSIPYASIPFPRARAERVDAVFSPAHERRRLMSLDPRDPPKDFEDEDDLDEEFEEEEEDDETI